MQNTMLIKKYCNKKILYKSNIRTSDTKKITFPKAKKYIWQSILIIFFIFSEIEAGKNFYAPVQARLDAFATAISLAYKKVSQPIASSINVPAFRFMQSHPKTSIFSIFGTALTGILLHRSHTKISTYFGKLHTTVKAGLLRSLQKIYLQKNRLSSLLHGNNPVEEVRHDQQELQEAQRQLRSTQEELESITARGAVQQAEYQGLQKEVAELRRLYELIAQGSSSQQQALISILSNVMESFTSAKDLYVQESQQFKERSKEWSDKKASLAEQCKSFQSKLAVLDGAYKEQSAILHILESKNAQYEAELSALRAQNPHLGVSLTKSDGATAAGAAVGTKSEGTTPFAIKGARSSGIALPQPSRTCSPLQDPVQKRSHTENPEYRSPTPTRKVDIAYGRIIQDAQEPQ